MTAKIEKINPSTLPDAPSMGYSQITVAEGSKLIFMSGQVAWTAAGDPVPEDLAAQAKQAIENVRAGLAAAGAAMANITSVRVYVVTPTEDDWNTVFGTIMPYFEGTLPSVTALGLAALAGADLKVEIEVSAMI